MSLAAGGGPKRLNLKLRKFDMAKIKQESTIVLLGKRRSGKSFCIRDLLWHHQTIPTGTVISATECANKFYSNMVPRMFIHDEFSPTVIANVLGRQQRLACQITRDLRERGSSDVDPRTFVILDDCLFDQAWVKDKGIRYLFMNGRHVKTMFIITMQYAMGIPPVLRTNIDYVFIFRENIISNRMRIYQQYAGMFPDFDSFCQVMNQCTENFECMVIDNTTSSNRIEDQVFWYKAQPRPDFRLCSPAIWAHPRNQVLEEEGRTTGEDLDPDHGGRARRYAMNVIRQ